MSLTACKKFGNEDKITKTYAQYKQSICDAHFTSNVVKYLTNAS